MTSRTSVQVGNGRALARLYSSIAITNSNCSSDIWPSSAALRSSLRRRPGPRRRSSPSRRSTTFCLRSTPLRRSTKSGLVVSASFLRRSPVPSQRPSRQQGLSVCFFSASTIVGRPSLLYDCSASAAAWTEESMIAPVRYAVGRISTRRPAGPCRNRPLPRLPSHSRRSRHRHPATRSRHGPHRGSPRAP